MKDIQDYYKNLEILYSYIMINVQFGALFFLNNICAFLYLMNTL